MPLFIVPAPPPAPGELPAEPDIKPAGLVVMALLYIPMIWISLALGIKRWHDRGKPGAWILIGLIPLVGALWIFVECGCLRGTVGPNRFGPDPT